MRQSVSSVYDHRTRRAGVALPLAWVGGNQSAPLPDSFNTTQVRVVQIDGKPWFVATDVCHVLGYHVRANGKPNTGVALARVDTSEKGVYLLNTPGGKQRLTCLSESGLYKLIMRSDKPEARKFQDWVTQVVLPAIRRDGAYIAGEEKVATGELSEERG